ncbi:YciI family protein [Alkalihalobacillus sp. AL-G]|uniref:YciI family protein n=1 Tax=Alkalihalobacillus sp. AL-G TaxID=2926399 RepID=UPI002729A255|nr:YciI family protein [Alkalihalobacillus sp. AL-G]WLD91780.1 YciI family protein [Alkalihalobacillus sp. AL-G]
MAEYLYKLIPNRDGFINDVTKEEEAVLEEHFAYIENLLKTGELVLAGPCLDGSLGVVILRVDTYERAEELMNGDPAVVNGIMQATLHPFRVSLMQGSKNGEEVVK